MISTTNPEAQAVIAFAFINLFTFFVLLFFNSPAPVALGKKNMFKTVQKKYLLNTIVET